MAANIVEVDSLQVQVIVDNELDPISKYVPQVEAFGNILQIALSQPPISDGRGEDIHQVSMHNICCSAHGLSLVITVTRGEETRSILFDTGPEEDIWERNARRLGVKFEIIDAIVLSHWHVDHSSGMPLAIKIITEARLKAGKTAPLIVDLHPDRPAFRGFQTQLTGLITFEADPTFEALEVAGGKVEKHGETHGLFGGLFLVSGEIPRVTAYEEGLRAGMRFVEREGWVQDTLIKDERFVMCSLKDRGLVVFTGCGHAGVVNTARHGLSLGEGASIYAIMGGYHLADAEPTKLEATVADIKALQPTVLLPGHCTGWKAKYLMENEMPGILAPSTVGTKFTFV